jgi:ABC-type sugar transport system ATPase subunit
MGNLAFVGRLRGVDRATREARAREVAALLGIEPLLDRMPGTLSGGERQRVAVGRAITADPECVVLDEPLGSLDAPLRRQMRAELRTLHKRLGRTVLSVTHDQDEAVSLADRVAVMDRGRIRQVGTPDEILRQPADRFVAEFMDTDKRAPGFAPGRHPPPRPGR